MKLKSHPNNQAIRIIAAVLVCAFEFTSVAWSWPAASSDLAIVRGAESERVQHAMRGTDDLTFAAGISAKSAGDAAHEVLETIESLFLAGDLHQVGVNLINEQTGPLPPQALLSRDPYKLDKQKLKSGILWDDDVYVLTEGEPTFDNIDFEREIIKWQVILEDTEHEAEREEIRSYLEELAITLFVQRVGVAGLTFDNRFGIKYNGNYVNPQELKGIRAEYNDQDGRFYFRLALTSASNGRTGQLIEIPLNTSTFEYMTVHPDLRYVEHASIKPREVSSQEVELAKIDLLQLLYLERLRDETDQQEREETRERLLDIRNERFRILIAGLPFERESDDIFELTVRIINDTRQRTLDPDKEGDRRTLEFLAYAQAEFDAADFALAQIEAYNVYHQKAASGRTLVFAEHMLELSNECQARRQKLSNVSKFINVIFRKTAELENQKEIDAQEANLRDTQRQIGQAQVRLKTLSGNRDWHEERQLKKKLKQLRQQEEELAFAVEVNRNVEDDTVLFSDRLLPFGRQRTAMLAVAFWLGVSAGPIAIPALDYMYHGTTDMLLTAWDHSVGFFGNIDIPLPDWLEIDLPGGSGSSLAYEDESNTGIDPVTDKDKQTVVFEHDGEGGFFIKQLYDDFTGRKWKKSGDPFAADRFFTDATTPIRVSLNTHGTRKIPLERKPGYTVDESTIALSRAAEYTYAVNEYGEPVIEFKGNVPDKFTYTLKPQAQTDAGRPEEIPDAFDYPFDVEFPDEVRDIIDEYAGRPYPERMEGARKITEFHRRSFTYDNSREAQKLYRRAGRDIVSFAYKHGRGNCNVVNACNFVALSKLGLPCFYASGHNAVDGKATEANYHGVTFAYNFETGNYEKLDATPFYTQPPETRGTEVLREFLSITRGVAEEQGPTFTPSLLNVIIYARDSMKSGDAEEAHAREVVDMEGLIALWERQLERIEKEGAEHELWLLQAAGSSDMLQSVFSIIMRMAHQLGAYDEIKSRGLIDRTLETLERHFTSKKARKKGYGDYVLQPLLVSAEILMMQCRIESDSDEPKEKLLRFFIDSFDAHVFNSASHAPGGYISFEASAYLLQAKVAESRNLEELRVKVFEKIEEVYGGYSEKDLKLLGSNKVSLIYDQSVSSEQLVGETEDLMKCKEFVERIQELTRLACALNVEGELFLCMRFNTFFAYASNSILRELFYMAFQENSYSRYDGVEYYEGLDDEGAFNHILQRGLIKSPISAERTVEFVFSETALLLEDLAIDASVNPRTVIPKPELTSKAIILLHTLSVIQTADDLPISSEQRAKAVELERELATDHARRIDVRHSAGLDVLTEIIPFGNRSGYRKVGRRLSENALRIYLQRVQAAREAGIDPVECSLGLFESYFDMHSTLAYELGNEYFKPQVSTNENQDIRRSIYEIDRHLLDIIARMDAYRHSEFTGKRPSMGSRAMLFKGKVEFVSNHRLGSNEMRFYSRILSIRDANMAREHLKYMVPRLKEIYGRRIDGPTGFTSNDSYFTMFSLRLLRDHITYLLDMVELAASEEAGAYSQIDSPLEFAFQLIGIKDRSSEDFLQASVQAFREIEDTKPHLEAELEVFVRLEQFDDIDAVLSEHMDEVDELPSMLRFNLLSFLIDQGEVMPPGCRRYVQKTLEDMVTGKVDLHNHAWSMSTLRLHLLENVLSQDALIPEDKRVEILDIVLDDLAGPSYFGWPPAAQNSLPSLVKILENARSQLFLLEDFGAEIRDDKGELVRDYDEQIHEQAKLIAHVESRFSESLPLTGFRMAYRRGLEEGGEKQADKALLDFIKSEEFKSFVKERSREEWERGREKREEEPIPEKIIWFENSAVDAEPQKNEVEKLRERLEGLVNEAQQKKTREAIEKLRAMLDELERVDTVKLAQQIAAEESQQLPSLRYIITQMRAQGYISSHMEGQLLTHIPRPITREDFRRKRFDPKDTLGAAASEVIILEDQLRSDLDASAFTAEAMAAGIPESRRTPLFRSP